MHTNSVRTQIGDKKINLGLVISRGFLLLPNTNSTYEYS